MQLYITINAALFGLLFGSFANVIIYRVPKEESIVMPASRCPACGKPLSFFDLIPVFSWLFLRGKCRYCKIKIPARYPAVELLCALLFAWASFTGGFAVLPMCMLAFAMLCVTFIDIDHRIIPDGLVIFGAVVGALWVVFSAFFNLGAPDVPDALLGALAGAAPLFLVDRLCLIIIKKDGFGFGDVKLMAMAGLYTGWQHILTALFVAVIAGGLYGGVLLVTRRAGRGDYFAFGPFLAAGVLIAAMHGEALIKFFFPYL